MRKFIFVVIVIVSISSVSVQAQEDAAPRITLDNASEVTSHMVLGYGMATDVLFSPDGNTLVVAGSEGISLHPVGSFGAEPEWLVQGKYVHEIVFSPDGTLLAWIGLGNSVHLLDFQTRQTHAVLHGHTRSVISIAFSPDGTLLATGSSDKTIRLWDVATGEELRTFEGYSYHVTGIAFSPDGSMLASAGWTIQLWDVATGENIAITDDYGSSISQVAFSPEGTEIVFIHGSSIWIWDFDANKQYALIDRSGNSCLTFSPDGGMLVTGSTGGVIQFYGYLSGEQHLLIGNNGEWVTGIAFHPEGTLLASSSYFGIVRLWDTTTGEEVAVFTGHGHTDAISNVVFSPDGTLVASAGRDSTIRLWDTTTGQERHVLPLTVLRRKPDLAFSPDGTTLFSAACVTLDGLTCTEIEIIQWNVQTGIQRQQSTRIESTGSLVISDDASILAFGQADFTIGIWDIAKSRLITNLEGHIDYVKSLSFSPDQTHLLSAGADGTFRVWDIATGTRMLGELEFIDSAVFGPDGEAFATIASATVYVWTIDPAKELYRFRGDDDFVNDIAFNPDGDLVVTGGRERSIRLWSAETGQELMRLEGHKHTIMSLAFNVNGTMIASGSFDSTLRLWHVAP